MLPSRLKISNPLPQLCEDPLLTGHSKETNKQTKTDRLILPYIVFIFNIFILISEKSFTKTEVHKMKSQRQQ